MGSPSCLIIASTSCKNCLQCAAVSLTELIKENELLLATNFSNFPLRLFLTVPAASVPGFILCITQFIDEYNWCCLYTDLEKNKGSASDTNYSFKLGNF